MKQPAESQYRHTKCCGASGYRAGFVNGLLSIVYFYRIIPQAAVRDKASNRIHNKTPTGLYHWIKAFISRLNILFPSRAQFCKQTRQSVGDVRGLEMVTNFVLITYSCLM